MFEAEELQKNAAMQRET